MIAPNLQLRRKNWLPHSYSNTWLTTLMVAFIVLISVGLSILFFWRSLYLPELKNHARYLTSELQLINSAHEDWQNHPEVRQWIYQHSHVAVVNNPSDFPEVADKAFVSVFTDVLQREIGAQLGQLWRFILSSNRRHSFGYKTVVTTVFGFVNQ